MTNLLKNTVHLPLRITARRLPLQIVTGAALALFALVPPPVVAQTAGQTPTAHLQPRITSAIDNSSRVTLAGSRPPRAVPADDIGAVPGSTKIQGITLSFSLSPTQQATLDALIAAQQNPASPQYHRWLTPDQYAAQFGVASANIAAVQNWLQQQGFTVGAVSRSRNRITFSGTAAQVEAAFGAPLHYFRSASQPGSQNENQTHFAPAADLSIPAALSSSILAVGNLSDFRPHPHFRIAHQAAQANFTSAQTGSHFLTANDVQTIYDVTAAYNAGYTGVGQSLAIVGQSAILTSDISNYQTAIGSTAKLPTQILVTGSGTSEINPFGPGDEAESDLDLEYSTTMAPGATVYFVYTGNNPNDGAFYALQYAVDQNVAPIISSSYGDCEVDLGQSEYNTLNASLAQAATQGQTVVAAAGDDGSTDCYGNTDLSVANQEELAVDFPASSQYVTGMGGTEFPAANVAVGSTNYFAAAPGSDVVSSALSYIPEGAWNDDSTEYGLSSGGGGVSIFTQHPSWQTGVPGIPASPTMRYVPDISLDASNTDAPYAICSSDTSIWSTEQESSCTTGLRDSATQDLTIAGGTSFDAPTFSALLAIINQARSYTTGQGLVNPTLYTLAAVPATYASAFHDITIGGNQCTIGISYCTTAGADNYATTTGYDEATGLGSIDFNNLLSVWPGSIRAANTSFAVTAGGNTTVTPGTNGTATITVTPANGYTGTVNFTVSGAPALTYACYTLPSATVTGTSAVTSTLTIITSAASCSSSNATQLLRTAPSSGGVTSNHTPTAPGRSPAAPLAATMAGVLLAGFSLKHRTRRSLARLGRAGLSLTLFAALGALAFGALGLSGCSSSAGGVNTTTNPTNPVTGVSTTPAGTYTITVTGISSTNPNLVSTTTFSLTVS